jgi:hypothetical protein
MKGEYLLFFERFPVGSPFLSSSGYTDGLYFQGLQSERRTNANGMSKLNPGSGLMAMIVLMMTGTFQSLKLKRQMVSNLSSTGCVYIHSLLLIYAMCFLHFILHKVL